MHQSRNNNQNPISRINQQIYYERLGMILKQINEWKIEKKNIINLLYQEKSIDIFHNIQYQHHQTINQLQLLMHLIYSQKQFYSALKSISNSKYNHTLFNIDIAFIQSYSLFQSQQSSLIQLKNFLNTFYSILKQQLTSNKKYYQEILKLKNQFYQHIKYIDKQQTQPIQNLALKKKRKCFNLKQLSIIKSIFQKQVNYYDIFFNKVQTININVKSKRIKLLQNIINNLNYLKNLYIGCFGQNFIDKIITFYKKKIQKNITYLQNKQQFKTNQTNVLHQTQIQIDLLRRKLQHIMSEAIQNITLRKLQVFITQNKQIKHKNVVRITIDHMILLIDQNIISKEIDLVQATLQYQNCEQNKILIKQKGKQGEFISMEFECEQRMEEFLLHFEQINLVS